MNGISRFFCLVLGGALLAASALAQEACLRDPARAHELRVLDEAQVIDLMDQYPVVAAPVKLHRLMASLIAASPRLSALRQLAASLLLFSRLPLSDTTTIVGARSSPGARTGRHHAAGLRSRQSPRHR